MEKQLQLAAFLEEIAEAEMAFDAVKQQLCRLPGFSPEVLFGKIARRDSHITVSKMQSYVQKVMPLTQRQLHELFCKFDWSRTGRISQQDFCRELRPYKLIRLGAAPSPSKRNAPIQAEKLFFELVKEYLNRWRIHQICRQELSRLIPYRAFDELTVQRRGYVSLEEIQAFLGKLDIPVSSRQLKYIMWGLKRRHYSFVTLEVFCQNLWPVEFSYYSAFEAELQGMQENHDYRLNSKSQAVQRQAQQEQYKLIRAQMRHERRLVAKLAEGSDRRTEGILLSRKLNRVAASRISARHAEELAKSNLLLERYERERQKQDITATIIGDSERLETPYFERQASHSAPKQHFGAATALEASRREAMLHQQSSRQKHILTEIEQQALLRRAQLQITNRLLERSMFSFDRSRFHTETAAGAEYIPKGILLSQRKASPRPTSRPISPGYDCIPITQSNQPEQQNQPLCRYSFGEEHLRVYRSTAPRNRQ